MNEQSYFHWDLFRPPLQNPSFGVGASLLDIRDEAMRGMAGKAKGFSMDPACALWSSDIGLEPGDCITGVGGRVLEIRKEKSRDAARSRRGKENYEFYELAKLLPLPAAITSQLDKASIIRLSISYLKLRDFSGHGDPPWNTEQPLSSKAIKEAQRRRGTMGVASELFELHQGAHILQSLDGFAFTLNNDGRFLYISETVSIYLGLSQVEMAGSSIFEYVHSQDQQELADQLGLGMINVPSMSASSSPTPDSPTTPRATSPPMADRAYLMSPTTDKGQDKCFCIRMKSTLTKRGVHTRSSGYRVLQINAHFREQINFGMAPKDSIPVLGLVAIAIALPPPTITELRLEADTFIMRLTPGLRVIYCENASASLTDWKCDETIGRDLYSFCHPGDIMLLRKAHTDLLAKGQVLTPSIRLLCKHGGYVWVQICATSLYGSKTSDDQTVLAIIYTLSNKEHARCPLDASQFVTTDTYTSDRADVENNVTNTEAAADEPEARTMCDMDTAVSELGAPTGPGLYRHRSLVQDSDSHPDNGGLNTPVMDVDLEAGKTDNKVSRRKTDRPRKRLRNSTDSLCESVSCDRQESLFEDTTHLRDDLDLMTVTGGGGESKQSSSDNNSSDGNQFDNILSPQAPEDLSMRVTLDKNGNLNDQRKLTTDNNSDDSMTAQHITSSMQELQKVVDRHLPSASNKTLTFPPDSLEKDLSHFHKHNSTIQWIGSNHTPVSADTLSAATILRQLYTSRESVIRSNSRPMTDGTSMAQTSEPFKDQLQLNIPQICNTQPCDADLPVSMAISSNNAYNMSHLSPASLGNKYTTHYPDLSLSDGCAGLFETPNANLQARKCAKMQPFPVGLTEDDMLMRMAHMPGHRFGQQMGPVDASRPPHTAVTGRLTPTDIYGSRPPQQTAWYELTG